MLCQVPKWGLAAANIERKRTSIVSYTIKNVLLFVFYVLIFYLHQNNFI